MAKSVFCWLILSFLLIAPQGFAANTAAQKLAEKIYAIGDQQAQSKQYGRALCAYDLAVFLAPDFSAAKIKKEKLETLLQKKAAQNYRDGLNSFQNKRMAEAKLYWTMAMGMLGDVGENVLVAKIEKALRGLDYGQWTIDHGPTAKKETTKTRQEMGEVKKYLEEGETAQAKLSLKVMAYENPREQRAQNLLTRLQSVEGQETKSESLSEEIRARFQEAEKLFASGKEVQAKKENLSAYHFYKQALSLFGDNDLKPPFYRDLISKNQEVEIILKKSLGDLDHFDLSNLKAAGLKLKKIEKEYPPIAEIKPLLEKVYSGLQKKAYPILIQAKTIAELEGCHAAMKKFEAVQEAAAFEEVKAWREAEGRMMGCGGRGEENGKRRVENGKLKTEN